LEEFNKEFVYIPNYLPIIRDKDGNWTGALGALKNGTVDTLIDSFYITPERYDSFAFANPIQRHDFAALYAFESPGAVKLTSLTAHVHVSAYALIAVACFLCVALNQFVEFALPPPVTHASGT
jgi:hypothetical protein